MSEYEYYTDNTVTYRLRPGSDHADVTENMGQWSQAFATRDLIEHWTAQGQLAKISF